MTVQGRDAKWEEGFAKLLQFVGREGHARVRLDQLEDGFMLGYWATAQRSMFAAQELSDERWQRLETLPGWVWDRDAAQWEEGFARLLDFVEHEGHLNVPVGTKEDKFNLGHWIIEQRAPNRLSAECRRRLGEVPGWTWIRPNLDLNQAVLDGIAAGKASVRQFIERGGQVPDQTTETWEPWFAALEGFVALEGHARVWPTPIEDGFSLGHWVAQQRREFTRMGLSYDRRQRLEALPGWSWDADEAHWEDGFAKLLQFVQREGDARVLREHVEDGFELGTWVSRERTRIDTELIDESLIQRGVFKRLSADRLQRLEALPGWVWGYQADYWEEGFAKLRQFVRREGHARVPYDHLEGAFNLGRWVIQQRGRDVSQQRTDEQEQRLEALHGWGEPFDAYWEAGLARLNQFVDREGHAQVPPVHLEGDFDLGRWFGRQRWAFRDKRLSADRRLLLEALPGWTVGPFDGQWKREFEQLIRFVDREGHGRVPHGHLESGFELGTWVSQQRRAYKVGELTEGRSRQLARLPGWAWEALDAAWEDRFSRLVQFVEREGHALVPKGHREDGFTLGSWVDTQRRALKANELRDERRRRLEALPGWTSTGLVAQWDNAMRRLSEFVEREGHAQVPQGHREDGFTLGVWVAHQRQAFWANRLSEERRHLLEGVPGWVWKARTGRPRS